MAIIIQKLANIVNIIADDRPAGEQILSSIELSSTAKIQNKGGSIPNVLQIWDSNGNQTANIEIDVDLQVQDEGGAVQVWAGTDDELVNKVNNEYLVENSGGGSGTSNVNITGDSVGLAKEVQFECKYTGYYLDLEDPDGGTWPEFPFDISQVALYLEYTPQYQIPNIAEQYSEIQNTKELAEFLNTIQNYFYFVDVSDTKLGVMAGKLPVNWFSALTIDTSTDPLEYVSNQLLYQTATEEFSTQDKMLLTMEQNAQKQNAPKGLATRKETLAFPSSGLTLNIAFLMPYREELIIRNNSATNTVYIGYFNNASDSEFTFALEPTKTLVVNSGHKITAEWETGSTSGEILITETI